MHLKYHMMCAHLDCGINKHPQLVMKELGITYQHATPQSMGDQWWFWNCSGVPAQLSKYMETWECDPHEYVGFGLSTEDAKAIVATDASNHQLSSIKILLTQIYNENF